MIIPPETLARVAAEHRRRTAREALLAKVLANEIAALRPASPMPVEEILRRSRPADEAARIVRGAR